MEEKTIIQVLWNRIGFLEHQCQHYFNEYMDVSYRTAKTMIPIKWIEAYIMDAQEDGQHMKTDYLKEMLNEWRYENEDADCD